MVEVVLTGPSADVGRALIAAELTTGLRPGLTVQAPSPSTGFHASHMADVRSAQDSWTSPAGQRVYRNAIHGQLPSCERIDWLLVRT